MYSKYSEAVKEIEGNGYEMDGRTKYVHPANGTGAKINTVWNTIRTKTPSGRPGKHYEDIQVGYEVKYGPCKIGPFVFDRVAQIRRMEGFPWVGEV